MLPSRSRLEGWNPDSLTFTGPAVKTAGESVERAVDTINSNIKIMPETKAWSGEAHEAASGMFDRAHKTTTAFSDYTTAIGNALNEGAGTIGAARKALLDKADEIDGGPLSVSDMWVVLIDSAPMSAEEVAELMERVKVDQGVVNGLLLAVGAADDGTANKVAAAAQPFGFVLPDPNAPLGMMLPGQSRPADDVPNPSDPLGLFQQNVMRGEDMAMNVRETRERYNDRGHYEKTLIMQDGSKHVVTEFQENYSYGVPDMVTDEHWDAEGNWISKTSTTKLDDGSTRTLIHFGDGTQFIGTETADGRRTGEFTLPDGRRGTLPPDSPFFTMDAPTAVGGALTGLEAHTARGGRLPGVSMDAIDDIKAGAKFGGPALGVLTTIWNIGTAETAYDRCVAGFAGSFEVVGDFAGGAVGTGIGSLAPPGAQAVTVPFAAVGGAYLGGRWMSGLGEKVAVAFCE
ncbi:MAG TPA: hypothetical protein VJ777_26710 [Mycobacterium sp.]|nr:hypothetical protein [Mycobacterium sp.]